MPAIIFITHPEVVIDPAVPVPQWPLSQTGRRRMERFARSPAVESVQAVICSDEQKAVDGAEILAAQLGLPMTRDPELGENDRSATGYIAPPEFWEVVDAFFANPMESIRGWERAADAQGRIVAAVRRIAVHHPVAGDVAIVSHGGVGSLLLAQLTGAPDARACAQPYGGGGCYLRIDRRSFTLDRTRGLTSDCTWCVMGEEETVDGSA
jgi:broad specificity phosphatase PhoE